MKQTKSIGSIRRTADRARRCTMIPDDERTNAEAPEEQQNDVSSESSSENGEAKPKLRISHAVAGICALLVAAAAGAAIVAGRALGSESGPRISYSSLSSEESSSAVSSEKALPAAAESSTAKTTVTKRTEKTTTAPKTTTSKTTASKTTASKTTASKTTTASSEEPEAFSYPQDINTASYECLLNVSGINKTAADGIVSYRNSRGTIHNFEELLGIFGIGERTLSVIKEHFYISDSDYIAQTEPTVTSAVTTSETETSTTAVMTTQPTTASQTSQTSKASQTTQTSRTTAPETAASSETASESIPEPVMKPVNINSADADELSECLLIDSGLAEKIVELRRNIGQFVNDLELLYVEGFSKQMLVERRPYILLEDE